MKKVFKKLSIAIALITLCLSVSGCQLFLSSRGDINKLPDSAVVGESIIFNTQDQAERNEFVDDSAVAAKVARSIVAIEIEYSSGTSTGTSYGSGVIVDVDSEEHPLSANEYYIITCHHVIASGGNITVYVPDANWRNFGDDDYDYSYAFEGVIGGMFSHNSAITLVGGDKDGDIAVLKLNVSGMTDKDGNPVDIDTCQVADQNIYNYKYAEKVFAIGNPSGTLPMTFMGGNISYIERKVTINNVGEMVLLQHDVMINHGSSGGGLFNMYGELIGITNAGSEEYSGLNYAIPFVGKDGFVSVAKQLIGTATNDNYGYVTGRWNIGITVSEGTSLNQSPFVKISSVDKNSNAYVAGLKEGDIIRAVKYDDGNGRKTFEVTTTNSFSAIVYDMKEILTMGDSFDLVVYRDYEDVTVTVNLVKKYIFCDTGIYPD